MEYDAFIVAEVNIDGYPIYVGSIKDRNQVDADCEYIYIQQLTTDCGFSPIFEGGEIHNVSVGEKCFVDSGVFCELFSNQIMYELHLYGDYILTDLELWNVYYHCPINTPINTLMCDCGGADDKNVTFDFPIPKITQEQLTSAFSTPGAIIHIPNNCNWLNDIPNIPNVYIYINKFNGSYIPYDDDTYMYKNGIRYELISQEDKLKLKDFSVDNERFIIS